MNERMMKEDKRVEKRQKAPFCPELVVAGTAGGGFVKARWKNENKPDRKDDGNERR
jgi:hypothetical protein